MATPSSEVSDDYEWQPPTEAEMKIIQARRERSNKISKLMGEYLLKGYKMLGTTCEECMTILMQDKQKQIYCIACNELDSDTNKDDPAMNQEAARKQVAEERERNVVGRNDSLEPLPTPLRSSGMGGPMSTSSTTTPSDEGIETSNHNLKKPGSLFQTANPPSVAACSNQQVADAVSSTSRKIAPTNVVIKTGDAPAVLSPGLDISYSIQVVQSKLFQATLDLESSSSVENSIKMCELIKASSESLASLYALIGEQAK